MMRFTALVVALGWLSGCATGTQPEARSPKGSVLVAAGWVDPEPIEFEYGIDAGVQAARPLHAPAPEYPEAERIAGVEAKVLVRYQVNEDGRVIGARAFGPAAFRYKALQALALWRFQPATRDGAPLRTRRTTEFLFRVNAGA